MVKAAHLLAESSRFENAIAWLDRVTTGWPDAEVQMLRRVLDAALPLYAERRLTSGEPVLAHVQGVVGSIVGLNLGYEAVAAALLGPLLEFKPDDARALREKFGAVVVGLAEGVSRMGTIGALGTDNALSSRAAAAQKSEQQAGQFEALRKMLLAMVQDVRVVLIKLADHAQDLRHVVKSTDAALRGDTARLTRDIFAPLANRLGVWQLKWELEDLAFRVLEPDTYKHIAGLLDEKRGDRELYIENVMALLRDELMRAGVPCEVTGRPKHIYSIYRKMQRKGMDFEALYDVRAVRILLKDVKDCYTALGVVHNLWSPMPKEFDDYIAKPKANNYRSLHTAVTGPNGKSVEVQIRTHDMHQYSELGVAAHWRYKEGGRRDRGYDEKISWLRQVLDWKDDVQDAGDLAEQFRSGLLNDIIYVLTPQGKVIDLPKGSTPVDFAYHVHTELGHRCRGARIDGVMVPLNTELHNGHQVEVITAKQGGPSRDWLNSQLGFIKSSGARGKVRQWFNRLNRDSDVAQGRALLEKELQRQGQTALNLDAFAHAQGYSKLSDYLAELGRGEISPKALVHESYVRKSKNRRACGGRRQIANGACEMLQAGASGTHRGLRFARTRRNRASRNLHQRQETRS
jgi:GTP pyrophosphokinase